METNITCPGLCFLGFFWVYDVYAYRLFIKCDPLVKVLLNDCLKHHIGGSSSVLPPINKYITHPHAHMVKPDNVTTPSNYDVEHYFL